LARALRAGAAAGALLLLASGPALAQRHGDRDQGDNRGPDQRAQQDQRQAPQRQEPPPREQRFDPRSFDSREFDERRQQDPAARAEQARRSGRLTPDERRDLRRQINEAGMDLYSRPARH
jgi:hypothetical protein